LAVLLNPDRQEFADGKAPGTALFTETAFSAIFNAVENFVGNRLTARLHSDDSRHHNEAHLNPLGTRFRIDAVTTHPAEIFAEALLFSLEVALFLFR